MAEINSEEKGMSAIISALLHNPLAAAQLFTVILGGAGLYFALSYQVENVRSEQLHDRQEVARVATQRDRDVNVITQSLTEGQARGVARYNDLQQKLDVTNDKIGVVKDTLSNQIGTIKGTVDKMSTDIEWLIRRLDSSSTSGSNNNGAGPAPVNRRR